MARRLTTFSKLLIVFAVVAAAFFGFNYLQKSGMLEGAGGGSEGGGGSTSGQTSNSGDFKNDDDVIKIGVVTWGGYAGGQYFNEGFQACKASA